MEWGEICCTHRVLVDMCMRIFLAVALVATVTRGANPGSSSTWVHGPGYRRPYKRPPSLVQREDILRSLIVEHPEWSTDEIAVAAAPILQAANLKPLTSTGWLRRELSRLRGKHNLPPKRIKVPPAYREFFESEFAKDREQAAPDVVHKFRSKFGTHTEMTPRKVRNWWHSARRQYYYGLQKSGGAASNPPATMAALETESDLPDLGGDLDDILGSDHALDGNGPNNLFD